MRCPRGIPLVTQDFHHIENLPEPKDGTYYIVLKPIALGCPKRKDLLIPGPLVRNDRGEPCGYRGLTRILSFKDCRIINQTGHDINVYDMAGHHLKDFPAVSEEVPRCAEEQEMNQEFINNFPVTWQFLGDVMNLPDEQPGTFYIVSRMVALAAPSAGISSSQGRSSRKRTAKSSAVRASPGSMCDCVYTP